MHALSVIVAAAREDDAGAWLWERGTRGIEVKACGRGPGRALGVLRRAARSSRPADRAAGSRRRGRGRPRGGLGRALPRGLPLLRRRTLRGHATLGSGLPLSRAADRRSRPRLRHRNPRDHAAVHRRARGPRLAPPPRPHARSRLRDGAARGGRRAPRRRACRRLRPRPRGDGFLDAPRAAQCDPAARGAGRRRQRVPVGSVRPGAGQPDGATPDRPRHGGPGPAGPRRGSSAVRPAAGGRRRRFARPTPPRGAAREHRLGEWAALVFERAA